jgi:hypothetical protein
MSTGALLFMLTSWTAVLGTMVWSFSRILSSQSRRAATPDPGDDMTIDERVPPTAM